MSFFEMLNKHQSIVVLNGTIDERLLRLVNTGVPLIAADGAADQLDRLGFGPDFVVGDGDSYDGSEDPRRIIIQDQDSTDFEKCIQFVTERQLFPSLVIGVGGGEIDHVLGNMQAIVKHARKQNLYFIDSYTQHKTHLPGYKVGIPLSDEDIELQLSTKCLISLLPFGEACVTTKGLFWELDGVKLATGINSSIRNFNRLDCVKIAVHRGKIILVVDITKELIIS